MKIELTTQQARLIKTLLQNEITDDDLKKERKEEYVYYLGKAKGEQVHGQLYHTLKSIISELDEVENIQEAHGYTMGLAQIVHNDIFKQIIED
jgi:hypothetical protein